MKYILFLRSLARWVITVLLVSTAMSARAEALDHWTSSEVFTSGSSPWGLLLTGVAYGNGKYVAVGQDIGDDYGVVQTSEDGLHWTMHAQDSSTWNLSDVAYGNGRFVAVGWDGLGGRNIYDSTNGIDWNPHYTAINSLYRVVYGDGLFVAVGDSTRVASSLLTNRNIYTSPNGLTWTARLSTLPSLDAEGIWDVAYGAGCFVAVDRSAHVYVSSTGVSWDKSNLSGAGGTVSYCHNVFIIPSGPGTNLLSSTGSAWTAVTNDTAATFGRVIYAAGCYLALAGASVYSSTNGTNWTITGFQAPTNVTLAAAVYAKTRFLLIGKGRLGSVWQPAGYFSDPVVGLAMQPGLPPRMTVSGLAGRSYRIERLEDLRSGTWQWATDLTLDTVPSSWTDALATNSVQFYRAVLKAGSP